MKNENKRKALTALVESDTITEAANIADVSRQSLWRYMKDPAFALEFKQQRERRAIKDAERLQREHEKAIQTIVAIMDAPDTPPQTRLKAAERLLIMYTETAAKLDAIAVEKVQEAEVSNIFQG